MDMESLLIACAIAFTKEGAKAIGSELWKKTAALISRLKGGSSNDTDAMRDALSQPQILAKDLQEAADADHTFASDLEQWKQLASKQLGGSSAVTVKGNAASGINSTGTVTINQTVISL